jgi:hypothetical protein
MSELQGVNQCLYAARPFYRVRRERLRAGRFDPKVDAALAQCAVNHAFEPARSTPTTRFDRHLVDGCSFDGCSFDHNLLS